MSIDHPPTLPPTSNANAALIIAVGLLGAALLLVFAAIVLFYPGADKLLIIGALGGVVALFMPGLLGLKVSSDNNAKITTVSQQVDGHLTAMRDEQTKMHEELRASNASVTSLVQENARLREAATQKAQARESATSDKAEIIGAIQVAVSDAAALAPPDHAPAGSTPTGTMIAPAGPTTIVVDATQPITVVPPAADATTVL